MRYFSYLIAALLAFLSLTRCSSVRSEREAPYVVMVSLDGFRWDYNSIYGTPVLDDIADKGVMASRLSLPFLKNVPEPLFNSNRTIP